MSIYKLKPRFQALLRPFTHKLAKLGISANQVTVFACLISILLGTSIILNSHQLVLFALIPLWMVIRMAMNAIDGLLAREFNQVTALGSYLNEIGDVISDSALYLPFALVPGSNMLLLVIVTILAVISELAGITSRTMGASRRYDGPMGKSDRAFIFGVLALFLALGVPLEHWFNWIWCGIGALIVCTIFNRVYQSLKEIKGFRSNTEI